MLFFIATALAYPQDVSILAMDDWNGASTDADPTSDYVVTGYETLVKELGFTVGNKIQAPAETLGVNGFSINLGTSFSFIRTGTLDGINPTGWDLAAWDEEPQTVLFTPQIQLRKGLPASLEIGTNIAWIGMTQTGSASVYGRWGLLEGHRQFPDFAMQLGYSGYIGNDELEVGALDFSGTLGYSLPFGVIEGINQTVFSPYVGIGMHRFHAAPRADLSNTGLASTSTSTGDTEVRVGEVSGFKSDTDVFDKQFARGFVGGGFRLKSGDFNVGVNAAYSFGTIANVGATFGWTY